LSSQDFQTAEIKALRQLTPGQRLELAMRFNEQICELRAAMLRFEHPDWSLEKIRQAVRDFVSNAES
jgi:DNA-binding transcriptional regulator WhiA